MINFMLIKKFFNIAAIFNEIITVKFVRLHFQSVEKMKEILFIMKCSQVAFIINRIHINILLNSEF